MNPLLTSIEDRGQRTGDGGLRTEAPAVIRAAQVADLPQLIELGQAFYAEGRLPGRFNPRHFIQVWGQLITTGVGVLLIAERDAQFLGAIGGLIYQDPGTGDHVAQEAFWFLQPAARKGRLGLRLLDAFEREANRRQCARVLMVHLETLQAGRLAAFYQRRGYQLVETIYAKELWP